jgi:hypothetical protein
MYISSSGGIPPDKLVCVPARREGFLLATWKGGQLFFLFFLKKKAFLHSLGTGYPLGYPDIRHDLGRKRTPAPAGIRQRITDIL